MGLIISRFRRKKTTYEILENLEGKIQAIEERGQWTEQRHKHVVAYMMAFSFGLYVILCLMFLYVHRRRSNTWLESIYYFTPLLIFPIVFLMLRRCVSWYYNSKLQKERKKLAQMRAEKKKILEEVMNTETYKVAKEILDKFASVESTRTALKPFVPTINSPANSRPNSPLPATPAQLRQRQIALNSAQASPQFNNSSLVLSGTPPTQKVAIKSEMLIRPLLGSNRSALDRVVDYLVGDGPSSRYALVCQECHGHNGMALAEEFEYLSFACAYCRRLNPARKQKPRQPPLYGTTPPRTLAITDTPTEAESIRRTSISSSGSDAEKHSDAESSSTDKEELKDTEEAPKSDTEKKDD